MLSSMDGFVFPDGESCANFLALSRSTVCRASVASSCAMPWSFDSKCTESGVRTHLRILTVELALAPNGSTHSCFQTLRELISCLEIPHIGSYIRYRLSLQTTLLVLLIYTESAAIPVRHFRCVVDGKEITRWAPLTNGFPVDFTRLLFFPENVPPETWRPELRQISLPHLSPPTIPFPQPCHPTKECLS